MKFLSLVWATLQNCLFDGFLVSKFKAFLFNKKPLNLLVLIKLLATKLKLFHLNESECCDKKNGSFCNWNE